MERRETVRGIMQAGKNTQEELKRAIAAVGSAAVVRDGAQAEGAEGGVWAQRDGGEDGTEGGEGGGSGSGWWHAEMWGWPGFAAVAAVLFVAVAVAILLTKPSFVLSGEAETGGSSAAGEGGGAAVSPGAVFVSSVVLAAALCGVVVLVAFIKGRAKSQR